MRWKGGRQQEVTHTTRFQGFSKTSSHSRAGGQTSQSSEEEAYLWAGPDGSARKRNASFLTKWPTNQATPAQLCSKESQDTSPRIGSYQPHGRGSSHPPGVAQNARSRTLPGSKATVEAFCCGHLSPISSPAATLGNVPIGLKGKPVDAPVRSRKRRQVTVQSGRRLF